MPLVHPSAQPDALSSTLSKTYNILSFHTYTFSHFALFLSSSYLGIVFEVEPWMHTIPMQ